MRDKSTDLTDLQSTMVQILGSLGINLWTLSPSEVTIGKRFIRVTRSDNDNGQNFTRSWSVLISPETQTISVNHLEEEIGLGFGTDRDGYFGRINGTTKVFQIVDNQMQLTTTVQQGTSQRNFLGERVDNLSNDKKIDLFKLPDGYTITDGIDAFTSQTPVKSK